MRLSTWFFAVALTACGTSSSSSSDLCELQATLDQAEANVGDVVIATSHTLTSREDTVIRVGGTPADVITVDRSDDCVVYDACIDNSSCTGCEVRCAECDDFRDACVQTVSFEVPAIASGPQPVVIQNQFGSTAPIDFTVLGSDSGDTGYSGARRRTRTTGFRSPFTDRRR